MTGVFDTHVHIWGAARFDYPWLAEVPALDACYPISAIDRAGGQVALAGGHGCSAGKGMPTLPLPRHAGGCGALKRVGGGPILSPEPAMAP